MNGGRRVSAERWAADLLPAIDSAKAAGAQSLRQIAARLNEQNITTPCGGERRESVALLVDLMLLLGMNGGERRRQGLIEIRAFLSIMVG
jgi:hypothetical protein